MVHEFGGAKHGKLRDMQAARRAKHPALMRGGMNLTQAARAVGVSKRTGRSGATAGHAPPAATNGRSWIGTVVT